MPKTKKPKVIEPYWQEMVAVFFDFTKGKFNGEEPTFDGSSPRDLKSIIATLRKRAEDKGLDWTQGVATSRLRNFLEQAYQDQYLSQNWILMNINRQKDRIILNAARQYLSR